MLPSSVTGEAASAGQGAEAGTGRTLFPDKDSEHVGLLLPFLFPFMSVFLATLSLVFYSLSFHPCFLSLLLFRYVSTINKTA